LPFLGIFVDDVRVWIGEKQAVANPDRTLGKFESVGKFEYFRVRADDLVDRFVVANDLDVYLARRDRNRTCRNILVKVELGFADPDEICRRIRYRTVDAKDRELDLLPGFDVTADDEPIGRVPSGDDRTALLAEITSDLAVDPNLSVIVERRFENNRRSRRVKIADLLRNGYRDAVPIKRETAVAATLCKIGGSDLFPVAVVKIDRTRVRSVIICLYRRTTRLTVRTRRVELCLDDLCVAVSPLAADQLRSFVRRKIDRCVRFTVRHVLSKQSGGHY
jgi:hypothetical protein